MGRSTRIIGSQIVTMGNKWAVLARFLCTRCAAQNKNLMKSMGGQLAWDVHGGLWSHRVVVRHFAARHFVTLTEGCGHGNMQVPRNRTESNMQMRIIIEVTVPDDTDRAIFNAEVLRIVRANFDNGFVGLKYVATEKSDRVHNIWNSNNS